MGRSGKGGSEPWLRQTALAPDPVGDGPRQSPLLDTPGLVLTPLHGSEVATPVATPQDVAMRALRMEVFRRPLAMRRRHELEIDLSALAASEHSWAIHEAAGGDARGSLITLLVPGGGGATPFWVYAKLLPDAVIGLADDALRYALQERRGFGLERRGEGCPHFAFSTPERQQWLQHTHSSHTTQSRRRSWGLGHTARGEKGEVRQR